MFRKLLLVLALMVPGLAWAQTTTVTGTVVDASGNAYFPGTVSAYIVLNTGQPMPAGVPASGSIGPVATTAGGLFSVTLASPFSWQFTVCGIPPSIGPRGSATPNQVCFSTVAIAISGASQSITGNLPVMPILGPNVISAITTVASNPATCVTGQTFFNTVTSQFLLCVATNVLTTAAGSPATTIDAKLYGVLSDARVLTSTTVSWTGATSTATVTATSGVFLPTDCAVGGSGCTGVTSKIAFGTNACCGGVAGDNGGTVILPQGTIATYISPTQITVSFSGTSTACNTTACIFVWGHDDTAALASAYTALLALGSDCGTLLLPAQKMLVQSALFITAPTCTGVSGTIGNTAGASETIEGFGMDSTLLIPTPNFNYATCTGGGGTACFFGWRFAVAKDWSIWGAGNSLSGGNHSNNIVELSIESYADKFGVVAWGASDTSLIGASVTNSRVTNSIFRGAGTIGCRINSGNPTWFVNSVCTYNGTIAMAINGPFYSTNGFYGITNGATSSLQVAANAYFNGDTISGNGTGAANTAVVVTAGNTWMTNGTTVTCATATANAVATNGGNLYARDSTFGGGSCNSINRIANTYFDLGGNTYTTAAVGIAPTCAMTTGGGTGPACATVAGSTNEKGTVRMTPGTTPAATGTTTITFAGTFAGASNTTPDCYFNYANTGTGAWSLTATTPIIMTTRSTTVPVFNWNNGAGNTLTAASTYDVDYVCAAR